MTSNSCIFIEMLPSPVRQITRLLPDAIQLPIQAGTSYPIAAKAFVENARCPFFRRIIFIAISVVVPELVN